MSKESNFELRQAAFRNHFKAAKTFSDSELLFLVRLLAIEVGYDMQDDCYSAQIMALSEEERSRPDEVVKK